MFKYLIKSIIVLLLIAVTCVAAIFHYYNNDLPDYSQLANYKPASVSRFYSSNITLLEEYANEHRLFTPIGAIPKSLVEAFISAEDKNFYEHPGLDLLGIAKAIISNVSNVVQNKKMRGASTITQQVVRNFLLTSERSLARKIKEAILSYKISQVFTKDQILELYLNQIYLGNNSYGVAAAALAYFNKSVEELDLAESAFLAALPKGPSLYDKNYNKAITRRNYVIYRMLEDGYITEDVAKVALAEPIKFVKPKSVNNFSGGYYADYVRGELITNYGNDALYNDGLTVITSLNSKYQEWADDALRQGIRKFDMSKGYRGPVGRIDITNWQQDIVKIHSPESLLEYNLAVVLKVKASSAIDIGLVDGSKNIIVPEEYKWAVPSSKNVTHILKVGDVIVVKKLDKNYGLRQIPEINGALVAIKPSTGQVLAMTGGYDFAASKFNRVTQALRQPGSSIKPFVYLAGLENNIAPNKLFTDEPIEIYQGPGLPMWKPKNYGKNFLGDITMRTAFECSTNIVTVKIAQTVGLDKVTEIIKRLNINSNPPLFYSSVLGSLETTLLNLTNAYAILVNSGNKVTPYFVELVEDRMGNTLYKRPGEKCTNSLDNINIVPNVIQSKQINLVDEDSDYQILSFMIGAVQNGNAKRAKILGADIGGKSGTSNDSKDVWFVGFKNDLVVGVYVGYDTPKSLGANAVGASVALPIFVDFMSNAVKESPSLPFSIPPGIKLAHVDPKTGEIMTEGGIIESFKTQEYYDEKSTEDVFDVLKQ